MYRCGGITISGLIASPIARKKNLGAPVLEAYEFVPNLAELDTEKSVRVNIQILLENTLVYKVRVVELIDEYAGMDAEPLTPLIKAALEDEPLVQPFVKILSERTLDVDVETENKNLETETDCLLIVASKILNRPEVSTVQTFLLYCIHNTKLIFVLQTLKQAFAALKPNGFVISREDFNYDIRKNVDPSITVITMHKTPFETMLLLQKQSRQNDLHCIKINSSKDFSWLNNVQVALSRNLNQNLVLYSEQDMTSGILGLVNCLRREPGSRSVRCVFIMDESEKFNPNNSIYDDQLKKNMAINVLKNGQWGTYRHLMLDKSVTVETERCFVDVTTKGDLSSLRWTQGYLREDDTNSEEDLVYVSKLSKVTLKRVKSF